MRSSADRFNYDYNTEELAQMAARVVELSPEVKEMHVVLNNNYEDQGQRNAKELMRLVQTDATGADGQAAFDLLVYRYKDQLTTFVHRFLGPSPT